MKYLITIKYAKKYISCPFTYSKGTKEFFSIGNSIDGPPYADAMMPIIKDIKAK